MTQYNATRGEITKFIWSDKCYVSVPRDKALVFVADSTNQMVIRDKDMAHMRVDGDSISVSDTPGGRTVEDLLRSDKISNADRITLRSQIQNKFISIAEGSLKVVFAENANTQHFQSRHLPIIMENKDITLVNHIEKKVMAHEYNTDMSVDKADSKNRITLVTQGKEDMAYLFGSKPLDPEIDRKIAIEQAIQKVGGEKLHSAFEQHVSDMNELTRVSYRSDALLKRKNLSKLFPIQKVFMKFEEIKLDRELKKATKTTQASEKSIEQLRDSLNSKENLEKIFTSANEVLKSKRSDIQVIPEGMNQKITKEVNRYVDMRKASPVHPDHLTYGIKKWGIQTPDQQVKNGRKL